MDVEDVGAAAGKIWQTLGTQVLSVEQLRKKVGLSDRLILVGLGWLAREGKVTFATMETGGLRVSLSPDEQEAWTAGRRRP